MTLEKFLNLFRRKQNATSQNKISEIEKIQNEIKLDLQNFQDIIDQESSHINNPNCRKRQYKLSERRSLRTEETKKKFGKILRSTFIHCLQ